MLETTALKVLLAASSAAPLVRGVLAEDLGVNEQAISSCLKELEHEGLVKAKQIVEGMDVELTPRGRLFLSNLKGRIGNALGESFILQGIVKKGRGEGRYYLSKDKYKLPLATLLGGEPYAGTLNVHVPAAEKQQFLEGCEPSLIEEFIEGEKTYGAVHFYPVKVNGRPCGLLVPLKSKDDEGKTELVDTVHLRSHLQLQDGDVLSIERQ